MCHCVRSRDLCALQGQSVVSPACRPLVSYIRRHFSRQSFFPSAEMCFGRLSSETHLRLLFFSQPKPGQSSRLFVWMLIGPGVLCLAEIDSDGGLFKADLQEFRLRIKAIQVPSDVIVRVTGASFL